MTPELAHLWALHQLDEQAIVHEQALLRLPARREQVESPVRAARAELERSRAHAAEVRRARVALEGEAATLAEQEKRFQGQLAAIKKNEEYQALLHEIAGLRGRRSDLETGILERLEEEERWDAARPGAEGALAQLEREQAAALGSLAAERQGHGSELAALETRRAAELAELPPATRSRYERIRASREGRAVVPIAKGACGGCFRAQPPQLLQEARRRDRVLLCDGCGRMLIQPPEAVAPDPA